jgi:type II secretory pathway predicted ATPase ExeA
MFLDFYQLKEQPFGVTPNPDFLYLGEQYREALASMVYAVRSGRGFHALIAPPGLGKTTLLFRFMNHLADTHKCVFLFNTLCNQREFLRFVLTDLEITTSGQDIVEMQSQLNDFLVRTAQEGKSLVLIVDEAQNLRDDVLEMIRLFSNFETPRRKLMHIVLAGQPQLEANLSQPHLTQLRQRVSLITRLKPLQHEQVQEYVEWRLKIAGADDRQIFGTEALDLIAAHSEGIPRNINNLCFHALSLGFAKGKGTITREIAAEAIADNTLTWTPPAPVTPSTESEPVHVAATPAKRVIPSTPAPIQIAVAQSQGARWPLSRLSIYVSAVIIIGSLFVLHAWPQRDTSAAPVHPPTVTVPVASAPAPVAPTQQPTPLVAPETKSENIAAATVVSPVVIETKAEPKPKPPQTERFVVIQSKETLWTISRREFPDLSPDDVVDAILDVNPNIKDPRHIPTGQKILLPFSDELPVSTIDKESTSSTRSKP